MRLDRAIALGFLAFCVGYGVLAWEYPLLPFERHVPFRPNTMPLGLAAVGTILSFAVLIWPGGEEGLSEDADGWRRFDWRAAAAVAGLMILYAGALRPLGYIPATSLFLICAAAVLGERRFKILIPSAAIAALATWWLVQEGLGVFLSPWPQGGA